MNLKMVNYVFKTKMHDFGDISNIFASNFMFGLKTHANASTLKQIFEKKKTHLTTGD